MKAFKLMAEMNLHVLVVVFVSVLIPERLAVPEADFQTLLVPTSNKVAFSAVLTHQVSLGYLQPVEFDKVITNIGNAYDPVDGHFIAPARGLYLLSASFFNERNHLTAIEMVKNGVQLGAIFCDPNDYNMSSQTIVVVLDRNDKVWLRRFRDQTPPSANLYATSNQQYNTFSGVLLYEM